MSHASVLRLFLVVVSSFSISATALAVPITFEFTGVVTEVDAPLAEEFAVGESVVGFYTFESTTPPGPSTDQGVARYGSPLTAFSATFGDDFKINPESSVNEIWVFDDYFRPR